MTTSEQTVADEERSHVARASASAGVSERPSAAGAGEEPAVSDATFMENVREGLVNGFDLVCAFCGVGVYDDSDMHERPCPQYVEFKP